MKYIIFVLGILTGLSFSRIPHYVNRYADHSLPKPEWSYPKVRGAWSDEDRRTLEGYYNGGVEEFKRRQREGIKGVQAWDANGAEIPDAQGKWERGEL